MMVALSVPGIDPGKGCALFVPAVFQNANMAPMDTRQSLPNTSARPVDVEQ
jgi:hypothetical protein